MKNKMITLLLLIFPAFAGAATFSPYADLTLNVHWDSQYQDLEPADLVQMSKESGVKSFHLAFITDAGVCQPAWGAQSSYAVNAQWGKHLTDQMHANHIDPVVSFGGATGNDISKNCDEKQLGDAYEQVITTYQTNALDFDIENHTADVPKMMRALSKVQAAHPDLKLSFTLPVLPEGLVAEGEDVVKQAKSAGLRFSVNIMAMDYGDAYRNDMGAYAIQAATNLSSFLKKLYPEKSDVGQMIEVTPMIGVNDTASERFTLTNVDVLKKFAKDNQLNGLSMWSFNRDHPCADKSAGTTCSGDNLQAKSYEFSQRFLQ